MPETSILIRTFNEERYIGDLLRAINEQEYNDFEIIVVDSGSTDRTLTIAGPQCDTVVKIDSRNFTFGYALNIGCRAAKGQYIVIVSAHTIPITDQWLTSMVEHFQDERIAMVYGRQVGAPTTTFSERRDFARFFPKQPAVRRYGNNANAAIRRIFWERFPFDESLTGLEDIHWAKRLSQSGYLTIYEPKAAISHIHEETPAKIYNRYRREAIASRHMGLSSPAHAGTGVLSLARSIVTDCFAAVRAPSIRLGHDILSFRYHQWKGSRDGWRHKLDLARDRSSLFYAGTNRGVVIRGPQTAAMEELSIPEVAPGDVLIRVSHVGVCKTDIEVYEGTLGYYKDGTARYPATPGHEFSGVVARVGPNGAHRLSHGDRVVGECILSCGSCHACNAKRPAACPQRHEVGVMNHPGAYAQYVVLPAHAVHRIPESLDDRTACLVEPLAVVLRGIRRALAELPNEQRVAVIGAGPIGNLCAQVLALQHRVTVFDTNAKRLALLGGRIETRHQLEGLDTFTALVEATGSALALDRVLHESGTGATILLLGFPYGKIPYHFEEVVGREKTIVGSVGGAPEDFERALELLPKIDVTTFTQHVRPLHEFRDAWDEHRTGAHLKILLSVP